eukprot:Seg404.5 transcript_id=Seg404.5/GoldUCD/mRNA.D3Y31 product="Coenzyme Q-binding protein COQ10 A mitochondrial" protein_id=Seg404.5/GoldUCD/D3Y31
MFGDWAPVIEVRRLPRNNMASGWTVLTKQRLLGEKFHRLRCTYFNVRLHSFTESYHRCGCVIKGHRSNDKERAILLARNSGALSVIRPSVLRYRNNETLSARTLFSNPFENVLKGKRKEFSERKVLGFSMDHMFDVVANVDDYKYFVPWCRNSKIIETKAGHVRALLEVGFPPLIERYTSILTLVRPNLVKSECIDGDMFNYMKAVWRFSGGIPGNPESCTLDFHIAFEFKSALHSHLSTMFFDEVVKKMVVAFENRCEVLHGSSFPSKAVIKRRRKVPSDEAAETS